MTICLTERSQFALWPSVVCDLARIPARETCRIWNCTRYPLFPNPLFLRSTRAWRYGSRLDEVHLVLPSWELWAGTAPAMLVTGRQAADHGMVLCDNVLAASPADSSSVKHVEKVFSVSDSMAVWGWEPIHFHWEKFQATAWRIFAAYSITIGGLHLGKPDILDWVILCCEAVLGLVGCLASSLHFTRWIPVTPSPSCDNTKHLRHY